MLKLVNKMLMMLLLLSFWRSSQALVTVSQIRVRSWSSTFPHGWTIPRTKATVPSSAIIIDGRRTIARALPEKSHQEVENDAPPEVSSMHKPKLSSISFLPQETVQRARGKGSNAIEKVKLAKDPTSAFLDVYEYARKIRNGEMTWEEVEAADLDTRLKWVGLLHRRKRTPGQFMMRLRVPNGIVTSDQMRFYANAVEPYGPTVGVVDITTRANIQLRGITLPDAATIIDELHAVHNQTSFQTALDNVRNVVGSPLTGLDQDELVDTHPLCQAVNDLITWDDSTQSRGNPEWSNLPRKFNIAIAGSPVGNGYPDSVHTNLNDLGLQPSLHSRTGQVGFNVVLGGYLSATRVANAVPADLWIPADENTVVALCRAVLRIFRDEGNRANRQKARLLWLVEEYGVAAFRQKIIDEMALSEKNIASQVDYAQLPPAKASSTHTSNRTVLLGAHPQSQPDKIRVGILVPVGRLSVEECRQIAHLADTYSNGEIRLTVDQNVLLPNVDHDRVEALLAEPALNQNGLSPLASFSQHRSKPPTVPSSRLKAHGIGWIEGHIVSCTGAEFCGLALIETKSHAERLPHSLGLLVSVDRPIHIHWTGCPNSCGQVQLADIGLMGAPAKIKIDSSTINAQNPNEKAVVKVVPGCKIFVRRPDNSQSDNMPAPLSSEPYLPDAVPLDDEYLIPVLVDILKREFGAIDIPSISTEARVNV